MAREHCCPQCGATLGPDDPSGLCGRCLLEQGVAELRTYAADLESAVSCVNAESPGRYTREREYARGGMGRILIARDEQLGRDVVVKELLPECINGSKEAELPSPFQRSSPTVTRFLREARVTGQLQHPSIVPVHELGRREDGTLYYTMKQVQGISLSDAIRQTEEVTERLELLPHFLDLCQAVSYAHSRGVIHRDIKPGNVMVGEFGETVLLDWGLAKVRGQEDLHGRFMERSVRALEPGKSTDAVVSAFGQVLGTPVYMAPEQARGESDQVDERSDVYALGAVLYTLLTGKPPFTGERSDEILAKVVNDEPPPVLEVENEIPRELAAICRKAMAKLPEDRYPSARELGEDLQRFLSGGLVGAHEYGVLDRLARIVKRHTAVLVVMTLALVALLAGGVYSYTRILNEMDHSEEARVEAESARERAESAEARAIEEKENAELKQYYRTIGMAATWLEDDRKGDVADLLMSAPEQYRNWEWGYLLSQCQGEEHRVEAHPLCTGRFALSPDGKWLVSHSETALTGGTYQIVLWDAETMEEKWRLDVNYRPAGVAIHPENTLIAVGGWGCPLFIYDLKTGNETFQLLPSRRRFSLCFSPDGKMLVEPDPGTDTLVVRRTQDWGVIQQFGENVARSVWAASLAFSPDGRMFASGGLTGKVVVRDTETWDPMWEFQGHNRLVTDLVSDSTSNRLISGTCGNRVTVWDIETQTEERVLPLEFDEALPATYLALAPDDSRLFVASGNGIVRCLRLSDGEVLGTLRTRELIEDFACSFENERVYVGDSRGDISSWSFDSILDSAPEDAALGTLTGSGARVCYSSDGKFLLGCYVADTERQIGIWDTNTHEHVVAFTGTWAGSSHALGFRPGTHEVLIPSVGKAQFYRVPEMKVTNRIPLDGNLESASMDASGRFLLSGDSGSTDHKLWDLERRQTIVDAIPYPSRFGGLIGAIAGDGKRAAVGAKRVTDVSVYQLPEAEALYASQDQALSYGGTSALAFHPNNRAFALGDSVGHIYIRSTESYDLLRMLITRRPSIRCLTFSPDGGRLLSGGRDGVYQLWDWKTGQELLSFTQPVGPDFAPDAAFSPDGKSIVLAGVDPPFRVLRALPWAEPDPGMMDSDKDGLTDAEETRNGTGPLMADSEPPSVRLSVPTEARELFGGEQLTFTADVSDDGRVMYADLLVNGELADSDCLAPYELEWTVPIGARIYELAIVATDTNKNVGTSETLRLEVSPDPLTTAAGRVVFADGGRPAPGARVTTAFGTAVLTGPQGDFSIREVKTAYGDIILRAGFEQYWAESTATQPVRTGVTEVGEIVLTEPVSCLEQTLTVGESPCAILTCDLNRDGHEDIVTGHWDSAHLSVLMGNGRGTFESEWRTAPLGNLFSMVAANMNDDNIPDIVTANVGRDDVAVLLGIGNGTFEDPGFHDVGDNPISVAVADLNGDHHPDIVTANLLSNDVSVLVGTGDGGFKDQQRYSVGDEPTSVVVLDVDDDGISDLVVANRESDDLSVLLGLGNATFEAGQSLKAGVGPTYLLAQDLDGDNIPDLAVANRKSEDVSILTGKDTGGFKEAKTVSLGQNPRTLTVADLDRDGIPDIVTSNLDSNSLSFLLGNGDGTFDVLEPWKSEQPWYSTLYEPEYGDRPLLLTSHQGGDTVSLLSPGPKDITPPYAVDERIIGTYCENPDALAWSTFLGGAGTDGATAVTVDSLGNFYVAGVTNSSDFPVTPGAYDETYNGPPILQQGEYSGDAYLAKFDGGTGTLVFATFLGGSGNEEIDDVLVLDSGEILVAGTTGSADFPTTPEAYDESHNGGDDIFVAKLNATGDTLLFSTFLGGSGGDSMWSETRMSLDALGNIYLTGITTSSDFPTTSGAYQSSKAGAGDSDSDAFVAKLSANGTTLVYSTFLGGSAQDLGLAVDVGPLGEAYVAGSTRSMDFPVTGGAYQETHGSADPTTRGLKLRDAFVTKLTADGSGLVYSTFLGGPGRDMAYDVFVDSGNEVFVAGQTSDSDFPTTMGAYDETYNGSNDMFLLKLNATGTSVVRSTLLGGGGDEFMATSMSRDALGNIWVSGHTNSPDVPVTPGTLHGRVRTWQVAQRGAPLPRLVLHGTLPQREVPYVAQFNASLTNLLYATFLDGRFPERGAEGFSVEDGLGNVFVAGATMSADFPVTRGAFDTTFGGDGTTTGDAFVTKLNPSAALTTASSAEDDPAGSMP